MTPRRLLSRASRWAQDHAGIVAWSLFGIYAVLIAFGEILALGNDPGLAVTANAGLLFGFTGMAFIGSLVASRRPDNPLGWFFCAAATGAALSALANEYPLYALKTHPGSLPMVDPIGWVIGWAWYPSLGVTFTFLFLLFPTGHLPSRRWRHVARFTVASIVVTVVGFGFAPGSIGEGVYYENPAGIPAAKALWSGLQAIGGIGGIISVALCVSSLFFRFRHARGVERQQLKVMMYAALLSVLILFLDSFLPQMEEVPGSDTVFAIGLLMIPIACAVAILRYRLYDIDRIISRTIGYAIVTGVLAAGYVAGVLLLQAVLPLDRNLPVTVAASTLAVVALFRPLRTVVQGVVDRRFYRRRFDASVTIEAFGARLRNETNLESLRADLVGVVRETMSPEHVSLWLSTGHMAETGR